MHLEVQLHDTSIYLVCPYSLACLLDQYHSLNLLPVRSWEQHLLVQAVMLPHKPWKLNSSPFSEAKLLGHDFINYYLSNLHLSPISIMRPVKWLCPGIFSLGKTGTVSFWMLGVYHVTLVSCMTWIQCCCCVWSWIRWWGLTGCWWTMDPIRWWDDVGRVIYLISSTA